MPRYQPFTDDELPEFIYLDTSFLVLAAGSPRAEDREEASDFMDRLMAHGTFVVVNNLVLLEAWHVAMKQAAKEALQAAGGRYRQNEHDIPAFRKSIVPKAQELMDKIDQILDNFVGQGQGHVVELGHEDMANARVCVRDHGLNSYDAAHAGTMLAYDLHHIATRDKDFAEIEDLTLWLPQDRYEKLHGNW